MGQDAEVTVRDSSGISMVELPVGFRESLPIWTMAEEPSVLIGEVYGEEPHEFAFVRYGARFSSGRIAVFEGREIRVFSENGTFLHRFGGIGDGPGEFNIGRVRAGGITDSESYGLWDVGGLDATVFSASGEVRRVFSTLPCQPAATYGSTLCTRAVGFAGDTTLVFADDALSSELSGVSSGQTAADHVGVGLVHPGRFSVIDSVLQRNYYLVPSDREGSVVVFRELFGASPVVATGLDRVVIGRGDDRNLRVWDPAGRLMQIIRFPTPRPITDDDYRVFDTLPTKWSNRAAVDRWLREAPAAAAYPLFGDSAIVGTDGRLWLRDYLPFGVAESADSISWTIFAPDGLPAARVYLPNTQRVAPILTTFGPLQIDEDVILFIPQQIDRDGILAAVVDTLDIFRIGFFSVGPDSGGGR